jgi:hypothetical protein
MFYDKALRLSPGYEAAQFGRAAALRLMAHPKDAQKLLRKTAKKEPKKQNEIKTAKRSDNEDKHVKKVVQQQKTAQHQDDSLRKTVGQTVSPHQTKPAAKPIVAVPPMPPIKSLQSSVASKTASVKAPSTSAQASPVAKTASMMPPTTSLQTSVAPKTASIMAPPMAPVHPVTIKQNSTRDGFVSTTTGMSSTHNGLVSAAVPINRSVESGGVRDALNGPSAKIPLRRAKLPEAGSSMYTPSNHLSNVDDMQSAPPISMSAENPNSESSVDSHAPGWLIAMAIGTFALLLVLAVWWLSPTLAASRQLHDRLKGLERRER